jgi:hypothetical protein
MADISDRTPGAAQIADTGDTLEITVPSRRSRFGIWIAAVWLILVTIDVTIRLMRPSDKGDWAANLIAFTGNTVIALLYCWLYSVEQTIVISAKELKVRYSGWGLRWIEACPLRKIRGVYFKEFARDKFNLVVHRGSIGLAPRFWLRLTASAAGELERLIYARFPQLKIDSEMAVLNRQPDRRPIT